MADQPLANKDKVRAELELDHGISISDIAKKLDMPQNSVTRILKNLGKSDESGDKRMMAKREAYKNGGTQVVKLIKEQSGANYRVIQTGLSMNKKRVQTRIDDLDTILKKLINYCKTYKDEELKKIFKKHLEEGGYWPNGLEKPK